MKSHLKLPIKFHTQEELDAVSAVSQYLKMTEKQFMRIAVLKGIQAVSEEAKKRRDEAAKKQQENINAETNSVLNSGTDETEPTRQSTSSPAPTYASPTDSLGRPG